jgi:methylmalonyl-CoA mutase N-terminal domain/subunit
MDEIDRTGGMLAAIDSGAVQQKIHESAYRWHQEVERGERVVVGVNRWSEESPASPPPFKPDPATERERSTFLAAWRAERDATAVRRARERLARDARGTANLMPAILDALGSKVTLGEVCDTLREVFGVHRPGTSR